MGLIKRDHEQRTMDMAEEMAKQRYQLTFDELCPHLQMNVWSEADIKVSEQMQEEMDKFREEAEDHLAELHFCAREGN